VVDSCFAEPRLAAIYDHLDDDRSDLDAYFGVVEELSARTVLDIGCGTGTFACLLAERGVSVTGLDPAAASLAIARAKPGADQVRWVHGDALALPELQVDLVTMTGNVAQVFLTDDDWAGVLAAAHRALRAGGSLVFETRRPAAQGWTAWTRGCTDHRVDIPGAGVVHTWTELVEVSLPLVSFQTVYVFEADGARLVSESTLRFRDQDEIEQSLSAAGFRVEEVREAPDRPGLEMVFIAGKEHRPGPGSAGQTAAVPLASARSDVQRLGAVVARKAGPWTTTWPPSTSSRPRPTGLANSAYSPTATGSPPPSGPPWSPR
jgi:ubiquinone/menaquinone biosynthesis C-methylase UbiE